MPDNQPVLPGIASAPGLKHHIFFAVLADADAGQKADRLCDEEMALRHLAGSKVRRERLHVTLMSLGWNAEFPEQKVWLARLAAAQVDAPAFPLWLDRCLSFQRRNARRPLVLCGHGAGLAGFMELYRSLYGALDFAFSGGESPPRAAPSVTPHMTLMYSPPWWRSIRWSPWGGRCGSSSCSTTCAAPRDRTGCWDGGRCRTRGACDGLHICILFCRPRGVSGDGASRALPPSLCARAGTMQSLTHFRAP